MRTDTVSISHLFVPWDVEVAYLNFGANCGPASFAAITEREVCRIMKYFPHFEHSNWTNLTQMRRAFAEAGYEASLFRQQIPSRGVALIQWLGPWTRKNFFSRWSLLHTHWVAVDDGRVFDHTNRCWLQLEAWEGEVASKFISGITGADGWAVKYGLEVCQSNSSWFGITEGQFEPTPGNANSFSG
jgi:hypothetical protein